jgi:hypothetical protein
MGTTERKVDLAEVVDRYVETWNETDPTRRRALIDRTWTEDGTYVDPLMAGDGHAGIDAMLEGVQARFPGLRLRRTGELDAHHDRLRFTWELALEDGPAVAGGLDVGVVAGDRLRSIVGFVDFAPSPE